MANTTFWLQLMLGLWPSLESVSSLSSIAAKQYGVKLDMEGGM